MTTRFTLAASLAALVATGALAQGAMPAEGETLSDNQTFTYRVLDEFPSIDPGMVEDVEGSHVARQLFEGLLNQDAEGNVIPGVATEWEVSEDGLTYTFHLRPEARWSNGEPVTAHDFVYAWQRAASPELASPYSWYLELMQIENVSEVIAGERPVEDLGVRAIDDRTLEVRITTPLPYFLQMLTHTTTFPVPRAVVEEHGAAWTQPGNMVGNGAYVLSERVPQERLVMTKNPEYWDAENVILEEITALIINDENQALTRYLAGELDQTDIPIGQYPRLLAERPDEAHALPNLCVYYYNLNLSESGPEALKDQRVRQALSLAIDRDLLVENVLAGGQVPAYGLGHWAVAGYEVPDDLFGMTMTQEERNAEAQRLMQEAGYGTGGEPLTLEILYNTSDAHQQLAVAIGQMWKQTLGVDTTLANMEWQTFLDARGSQQYEVARAGWCADYNEASSFLDIVTTSSGYNDSAFSNPELDALMLEARTAEDTLPLYQQVDRIIAEQVPVIPIYFYSSNILMDPSIRGYPFENAQENWYGRTMYRVAEQ
ncbi:ABC-type oligopeptide transport system, periplasmic component [Rubellimicrobium thermophilum DSM 16684]|uniref:ABC-type oligopeptide transport system, periplasmic component n=1 Tax=Rubellimicrobium thermophilum DSM 16684 TaxID=1123069 RepID=S9S3B3_9RHOB|nr:peptide ABC transporter substrate-binding protein [Rubellimicrobium thermophilum]EPX84680.1 ABC-type oligopeptide transport system, periplasmic component [Rubellimicrobium thermophilum DSM 16684]